MKSAEKTTLRNRRLAAGLTQKQLAESSGVNLRLLQYYEQGYKDISKASGETLYRLAKTLNCQMEDLIGNFIGNFILE